MNYWMNTIINRLETAYQTRFDMKAYLFANLLIAIHPIITM